MRVLYPVGMFRKRWYDPVTLSVNISMSSQPSIWKVVLDFCRENSAVCFSTVACGCIDDDFGVVREYPLKGINGRLLSIGTHGINVRSMSSIDDFAGVLNRLFNYADSTQVIDAVIVPEPSAACCFRNMACDGVQKHRPLVAIRTCHGWFEVGGVPSLWHLSNVRANKELVFGLAEADLILANAPHFFKAFLSSAGPSLSSAEITKVRAKTVEIPHGVADQFFTGEDNRGRNVGLFGRLSDTDKGVSWILDGFKKMYQSGSVDHVFVTSPLASDSSSPFLVGNEFVDFKVCGADFVDYAKLCRCSILDYSGISCPVAMMELMAAGVVPIVPSSGIWAKAWFAKYLPPFPFTFDSKVEAIKMASVLCANDELFVKWSTACRDAVGQFRKADIKKEMFNKVQSAVEAMRLTNDPLPARDWMALVSGEFLATTDDLFSLDDAVKFIEDKKVPSILPGGVHLWTPCYVHRFLLSLGLRDTLSSIVPHYAKGEV